MRCCDTGRIKCHLYHRLINPFALILHPFGVFLNHLVFEEGEGNKVAFLQTTLSEVFGELYFAIGIFN